MERGWMKVPYLVDEKRYRRFSEANIAFNTISKKLGHYWVEEYMQNMFKNLEKNRISSLSGDGYPDARLYVSLYAGSRTFNAIIGPYGEGRENMGYLSWNPLLVPEKLYRQKPISIPPEKLSRVVKRAAIFYGADKAGIARLDRKWVYSETEKEMEDGTHVTKKIVFEDVDHPYEDDEKLVIPEKVNRAVVLIFKHDYDFIKCSPDMPATTATNFGYAKMGFTAVTLAEFIRAMGYTAIPCMNDTAMSVPLAIDAGLGEFGRHGLLITPEFGSNIRIAKVLTDMPLETDKPVELGIKKFCQVCKVCAEKCPSSSIPHDDNPAWEGNSECNNPGVYKWYVDVEKCLRFWISNGASCSNCIAYCPFTKPEGFSHDITRWFIKHIPQLDRVWVWFDRILGYERKKRAEELWR